MYGWVKTDGTDNATGVSVKIPISADPFNDHAVVGTFYFKKVRYYNQALENLLNKDIKVNGEFYVDSMVAELVELGLKVKVFEVADYICWGTPDDYETFVYWQSFFHKAAWHPYRLENDRTVNKEKITELDQKYRRFEQQYR